MHQGVCTNSGVISCPAKTDVGCAASSFFSLSPFWSWWFYENACLCSVCVFFRWDVKPAWCFSSILLWPTSSGCWWRVCTSTLCWSSSFLKTDTLLSTCSSAGVGCLHFNREIDGQRKCHSKRQLCSSESLMKITAGVLTHLFCSHRFQLLLSTIADLSLSGGHKPVFTLASCVDFVSTHKTHSECLKIDGKRMF